MGQTRHPRPSKIVPIGHASLAVDLKATYHLIGHYSRLVSEPFFCMPSLMAVV